MFPHTTYKDPLAWRALWEDVLTQRNPLPGKSGENGWEPGSLPGDREQPEHRRRKMRQHAWASSPLIAPISTSELTCSRKACPKSRNCTPFNWTRLGSSGKDWTMTLAPKSLDPSIFSLLEYKQFCRSPKTQNEVKGHRRMYNTILIKSPSTKGTVGTKDRPWLFI